MACVTVTSLVSTLELEFLSYQPRPILLQNGLISVNKHLVESLCEKLQSLMEQFDEHRMVGVEALKLSESKLRDVASRVEDEIEFQVADLHVEKNRPRLKFCLKFHQGIQKPDPCHKLHHTLQQAIQDINHIEEELVRVKMEYEDDIALQGRNTTPDVLSKLDEGITMGASSQHAPYNIMVGKNKEFQTIKEMLIEHPSRKREVVSIKGMGGIGKTTLARHVYEDPSIADHFDKRAWVVASQQHNKRQMLLDLFKSVSKQDSVEHHSDDSLAEKLYQGLKRQRYLIVIDDIWSKEAWDAVQASFPDDKNGSRVLLTTRLEEVANYISPDNDFSHQMYFLDQSESWNLFCEKVLLKGADFERIVRPVVEKCSGLPLAIVVAAGLFSKLNSLEKWKYVAKSLNSSGTTTIVESCSRILSFSYNHLPHKLKACFLYLRVFPEDSEINASNLARLWAAEGLVKAFKNESLELVGQKHVQELSDRNLILVSKHSSNGRRIKAFRIHDVLHAFCVREAQNENLLKVVGGNDSSFYQEDFRWLSIQSSGFDIQTLRSSSKKCRSILSFLDFKEPPLNFQNLNLLRVLYFSYYMIRQEKLKFSKVVPPVHLRFICIPDDLNFNPKVFSLSNNLQTLRLPRESIPHCLDFPNLCYLHCWPESRIYSPKFVHQIVQRISEIHISSCTKELFTKIPYLKELGIGFGHGISVVDCMGGIGNLACLQQLERLEISQHNYPPLGGYLICTQIALLKNLKVLTFYGTRFRWEEINILSMLPKLEWLCLWGEACEGQKWTLREEEKFYILVSLLLGVPILEDWEVNADNFPKLEHLLIQECHQLKEIPSSFSDISTLKSIELLFCYPSLVTSAKQILEEQHDQGNYNMVVVEKHTHQPEDIDVKSKEESDIRSEEESDSK